MDQVPAGWSRFVMKSKFGAGRDFEVTAADGNHAYFVDGKLGPRPNAEIRGADDATLFTVRGHLLGVPKQMVISDAGGKEVASMKAKFFSPIKSKVTLTLADGDVLHMEGSLLEKDYSISRDGVLVAAINQKWVTVRDAYSLAVSDALDPALALAVVWAVDRWVERD